MASRVLWRRTSTAVLVYTATVLGVLGTIVAARALGPDQFGLLALALAACAFAQVLLDTTVEEAIVKYGYRYATTSDWGRLRRLFRLGVVLKWGGAAAASVALLVFAPFAERLFDTDALFVPMLVAAAIPVVQAPEGMAGAVLMVRGRYDIRAGFMALSTGLRLVGLGLGAQLGVTEAVVGYVLAQVVSSAAIGAVGLVAARRFPQEPQAPLGEDAAGFRRFVLGSAAGTALVSTRVAVAPLALGVVAAPAQVGYFRAAHAPLTGFAALSAPIRLIMLSDQTRDVEAGRTDAVWSSLRRYVAGAVAVAIVAVPVGWLLAPWLVPLVLGEDYRGAIVPAQVLLVAAALQLVLGWSKSFPVSIGRPGLRIIAHGVEVLVLLPLVLVLGAGHGATGAAIAYVVATGAFALTWAILLAQWRASVRAPLGDARA